MKKHILPVVVFILLTLYFTFPIFLNMNSAVYGPLDGTDSRGTIWQLWWGRYSHEKSLDYTLHSTIAAPYGNDVSSIPNGFLWTVIVRWLPSLTNEIFTYNFVLIISFILSCLFVYLVTFSITKNVMSSFFSGLIFGFCPYHFQRSWEHFTLAQIQWVALYLFALIRIHKTFNWKNVILFILSSTLVLHMEFNYTYIVFMLTVLFIVFVFLDNILQYFSCSPRQANRLFSSVVFNLKFVGKFVFASLLCLIVNFSLVLGIFRAAFIIPKSVAVAEMGQRPFHYLFSQSASVFNYLVPSSSNPVLGGVARFLEGSIFYGRGPIEQTLYLGWVPILFAWIAWKNRAKLTKKDSKSQEETFYVKLLLFIAIGSVLLSMPPFFNLGFFKIYFPSFFMYKILPMFRAYARFGILAILSVSILAGIGYKYFLERSRAKNTKVALSSLFIFLLLFEFNNIPPFRVTNLTKPPQVYSWLADQEGDFIIAEYPLGEASRGETFVELDYLLYQRIHQKRILNGAKPGTKADEIKQQLFRIDDPNVPEILRSLGVKYVVLHLRRYREGTNKRAVDIIGEVPDLSGANGLKLIKRFSDDEVYEVIASAQKIDI